MFRTNLLLLLASFAVAWLAKGLTYYSLYWFIELWARSIDSGHVLPGFPLVLMFWGMVALGVYTLWLPIHQLMYRWNFRAWHWPTLWVAIVPWGILLFLPCMWLASFMMFLVSICLLLFKTERW